MSTGTINYPANMQPTATPLASKSLPPVRNIQPPTDFELPAELVERIAKYNASFEKYRDGVHKPDDPLPADLLTGNMTAGEAVKAREKLFARRWAFYEGRAALHRERGAILREVCRHIDEFSGTVREDRAKRYEAAMQGVGKLTGLEERHLADTPADRKADQLDCWRRVRTNSAVDEDSAIPIAEAHARAFRERFFVM